MPDAGSSARVAELQAALSEGRLTESEARELLTLAEHDPIVMAAFGRGVALDRMLRARNHPSMDAARFVATLDPQDRSVADALMKRIESAPAPRRRWPLWIPALGAAVVLTLLIVGLRATPSTLGMRPRPSPTSSSAPDVVSTPPPVLPPPRPAARAPLPRDTRVQEVVGDVQVVRRGLRLHAQAGLELQRDDLLVTSGESSVARLTTTRGASLRLDDDAIMAPSEDDDRVVLLRGRLEADVPPRGGSPFTVVTSHAEARVLGTRFSLSSGARATRLSVTEGRVELRPHGADAIAVNAGEAAIARAGEPAVRGLRAVGASALMVVGVPGGTGFDRAVRARLQAAGIAVTFRPPGNGLGAVAQQARLVLVAASAKSDDIGAELRNLGVPMVVWEPWLFDDLGMTGARDQGSLGLVPTRGQIFVRDPHHALAAGYAGTVVVLTNEDQLVFGTPSVHARWIATAPGAPDKCVLFGYERDAQMVGLRAPARRVGLFFRDFTSTEPTAEGWALFEAAVRWALEDAADR